MDDINKKCSNKEHKDINAIYYCQDCKIYICNKCSNHHQELFNNHYIQNLDNNKKIFIDICEEKNHPIKMEFYCKNHNKLCCVACISKIEVKGYGQHKDCDVCIIENIKEEKKNKLNDNIKYLEDLSNNLNNSIKEIKILFDKINERKEKLKLDIQKIFTKLRNQLNEREDELLLEIDNKFNSIFGNEDIIKESEKLPNKIKLSLENGKLKDNDWNDNSKLSSNINTCINIEDDIRTIKIINDNIKKYKLNDDINIIFKIDDEFFENYFKMIKSFVQITNQFEIDSLILKSKDQIDKFYNLLSNQIKINNINLLYRASRDGLNLNNMKNKINNKSNLIFLFLAGESKIFGCFAKTKMEVEHNTYIKDKDAFVFSLNNHKIYKILIPEYANRFHNSNPVKIGNNGYDNGFYIFSGKIQGGLLKNPKIMIFKKMMN